MALIEPRFRALFLDPLRCLRCSGRRSPSVGATLPKILADFQWNYLVAGLEIGAGAVAYFVSAFAAGYLIKHFGPKATILLGLLLEVVGLSFFVANA